MALLALGAVIVQLFSLSRSWQKHDEFQLVVGAIGIGLATAVFTVNQRLTNPMPLVGKLAVLTLTERVLADMVQDLLEKSWTGSITLLEVQILGMVLFAILPMRLAASLSVLLYTLLVGVVVNANANAASKTLIELLLLALGLGTAAFTARYSHYVNEQQVRSAYLEGQLTWDSLTGTLSRRGMEKELGSLWESLRSEHTLMLVVDVDRFKQVNDSFGHLIGDRALQMIGVALRTLVPKDALVGRWGGEEFWMVLPGLPPAEHQHVAEQLLLTIRTLRVESLPPLTVSVGGATFTEGQTVREVMALADARLYEAKNAGRDRAVLT